MEWKWQISLALDVVEGPNFSFQLSGVCQYDGKTEKKLYGLVFRIFMLKNPAKLRQIMAIFKLFNLSLY